jgi:hypothetical protein
MTDFGATNSIGALLVGLDLSGGAIGIATWPLPLELQSEVTMCSALLTSI